MAIVRANTVFEKGEHISYGACGLPYYVSDVIKDHRKMMIINVDDFAKEGIDIHFRHGVVRVVPEDNNILESKTDYTSV
ncbi:hypothetical protein [Chengkuizengella axinellae]|uniref:Uncharacterized protein n=1 Tax=Chengkuizengella axinellae TaxID=3064388 RepID=A0ABT9J4M5_9BACL|nr:hypothetical protein [Chengkuizengella sp. 2205SS18-9]MDP5275940.1 hypothetical protein [Chengkuizengella sp. 2205SS18-9]